LKKGVTIMKIRVAELTDAESLGLLIQKVESSSNFMLYGPGERKLNPENQRKMIQSFRDEENSTILVCEYNDELVGYLIARGGFTEKTKHSVYLVIGILEEHRGKGIGTRLFDELINWAKQKQLHRLELTVMAPNEKGIALYKKMGFEIEGTKRHSIRMDNEYVDEYYMSMLI
jgi:RimJ/RimL family protein N-acetyltransferase